MMYNLSRAEQETTIRWDAEANTAIIDTATPSVIRKLDKLVETHPETYKCIFVDSDFYAKKYEVAAGFIRFGKPASEARKKAGRASAARLNASKIDSTSLKHGHS